MPSTTAATTLLPPPAPLEYFGMCPMEILLMIADRLPEKSRIMLGLTSKAMMSYLYEDGLPTLSTLQRLDVLPMLERDIPNSALCYSCLRFHPFDPHHNEGWRGQKHQVCEADEKYTGCGTVELAEPVFNPEFGLLSTVSPMAWCPEWGVPELSFGEVHQVMNRCLWGAGHGLSMDWLRTSHHTTRFLNLKTHLLPRPVYSCDGTSLPSLVQLPSPCMLSCLHGSGPCPELVDWRADDDDPPPLETRYEKAQVSREWEFSKRQEAKVIDGQLYLVRSHSIAGPPVSRSQFDKLVYNTSLPICKHLNITGAVLEAFGPTFCSDPISAACSGLQEYPETRDCHRTRRSCLSCFTDYELTIRGSTGRGPNENIDCTIQLDTYHCLGSCRTPDDLAWGYLTDLHGPMQRMRECRKPKLERGRVQRLCQGVDPDKRDKTANWANFCSLY